MDYLHHRTSPLGTITMASDGEALIGLWFVGQKHFGETLGANRCEDSCAFFSQVNVWLDCYFQGQIPHYTPPLHLRTTAFRQEVFQLLLTISYGQTISYGEIANIIAKRRGMNHMSARAIGSAVAHNPISLIIPCHRVVAGNGDLRGYAGGIEKKQWLLALERKWSST